MKHFHVICRDVFEKVNFEQTHEVADANAALESAITGLPDTWEGFIEIWDDRNSKRNSISFD